MRVDYKVTMWVSVGEFDESEKDEVIKTILNGGIESLWNRFDNLEVEQLDETETRITVKENNGRPTIELVGDDDTTLWNNTQEY